MTTPSPQEQAPPKVSADGILPGDTVLCYSSQMEGEHVEVAGYCHVAIGLGDGLVLQADGTKVSVAPALHLLETYDHLAILRDRRFWGTDEIKRLRDFATKMVGKPFNRMGMMRLPPRQKEHAESVMSAIANYMKDGTIAARNQETFFCSQLVAEALIDAGVIGEGASIALDPLVTSPLGVSTDGVFGTFLGYLTGEGYRLPADDKFRRRWTAHDWK